MKCLQTKGSPSLSLIENTTASCGDFDFFGGKSLEDWIWGEHKDLKLKYIVEVLLSDSNKFC